MIGCGTGFRIRSCAKENINVGNHALTDRRPVLRLWARAAQPLRLEAERIYDWKETVGANLVTPDATGTKIRIEGSVLDGDGMPINDAMIEIWQADAQGRYAHPRDEPARARTPSSWASAARPPTRMASTASTPSSRGRCPAPTASRRRRISCSASSRAACCGRSIPGSISPTRQSNATDPILTLVPADRRGTLIAHKEMRRRHAGLPLRHPRPGRKRDGFLRHLTERHRFSAVSGHLPVTWSAHFSPTLSLKCGNCPHSGAMPITYGLPEFRYCITIMASFGGGLLPTHLAHLSQLHFVVDEFGRSWFA